MSVPHLSGAGEAVLAKGVEGPSWSSIEPHPAPGGELGWTSGVGVSTRSISNTTTSFLEGCGAGEDINFLSATKKTYDSKKKKLNKLR